MKQAIFEAIIDHFRAWAQGKNFSCAKGCATCCTTNVTLTHLESLRILKYLENNGRLSWFAKNILARNHQVISPLQTTNEWVATCLEGLDFPQQAVGKNSPCPFLLDNFCSIYPVRPFACLFFASEKICQKNGTALVPDHYATGGSVIMQLLEHLSQFKAWGNMLDMLTVLSQATPYDIPLPSPGHIAGCKQRLLTAQPIPGFLVPEEDQHEVYPLLDAILHFPIGGKTIEQIFNGR